MRLISNARRGLPAFLRMLRVVVTLSAAACAIYLVILIWDVYILSPWTRDARVLAQTVIVAPEVSGTVIDVPLTENQNVREGQVLFRLDPIRFKIALAQATSQLATAQLQLTERQEDQSRREGLAGLISSEERINSALDASIAEATLEGAQAAVDLARLNLDRSTIYAPVGGYITHLRLQAGDYVDSGQPVVTVLDSSTFQVVAYFEETKLGQIKIGQAASVKLMGYGPRIEGHIVSIGRGIGDDNGKIDALGLPVVNPVFDWVRLAQRIPVDVNLDAVPAEIILASGMTCSVDVGSSSRPGNGIGMRLRRWLENNL